MAYILAKGTTIGIGSINTSPAGYTNFGQVTSIANLQSGEAPDIDVSNFDSTVREFVTGLKDEGSFTFTAIYDPTDAATVEAEAAAVGNTEKEFKITFPDTSSTTISGEGYVKTVSKDASGVDDVWRATFTVRPSDAWTIA